MLTTALLLGAAAAQASPATLRLDAERSRVRFEVDSTLHRVHGSARLVSGEVRFDTEGGSASGRIEVDATSADTGNGMRDGVLRDDVLEGARFPRIAFVPEELELVRLEGNEAQLRVRGRMDIHGGVHALEFPARVQVEGGRASVSARFAVPYVEWGMQDPGNFLLSVDDVVQVEIEAVGRIDPPPR